MKSVIVVLAVFAVFSVTAPVAAGEYRLGALVVEKFWARATPGVARNGAAYVTIGNRGRDADRLIAVSSPAAARPPPSATHRQLQTPHGPPPGR